MKKVTVVSEVRAAMLESPAQESIQASDNSGRLTESNRTDTR